MNRWSAYTVALSGVCCLAGLLAAAGVLRAAPPATQGAAATTQADISGWFTDLADPDPAVRLGARTHLASLAPDLLPTLRQIVVERPHLRPSQIQALYEIVTHVFLAGQSYQSTDQGFLGVRMATCNVDDVDRVEICQRISGFCAFASLQDGDVVLAVDDVSMTAQQFSDAIRQTRPGHSVTLSVLRQGATVRVPVVVSSRPIGIDDPAEATRFGLERHAAAQDYWNRMFSPVLEAKQAATAP